VPPPGDDGTPSSGPTHLELSDVYLLTEGPDGPAAVPGLRLGLDDQKVTLAKGDGTVVWSTPWENVAELATPERSKLPDGEDGVVLVVTPHQERAHRFVVPSESPPSLEATLESVARRHGVAADPPERTLPAYIVAGAVVVVAGTVAILLLAAGHIVHL